ncbi:hypothetical protein [Inconstantimicrobium mannanitabidum]|uniref:Uncharacterized protein n=1 Tax=Inconstantimicrobium mannanitabidum TaxID=1604901 RepID=A0ACB5RAZ0_9CLOT|nr:hypothetical protein [Clostridium sp. TW13]GKX66348.1 hypothetical protein rsdtw13_16060 [Clostridium sp. TW13]
MKTDGEIEEAMDALYKISGDKQAIWLAEMREKALMDEQSRLKGATKEGIEIGKKQKALEITKNLLDVLDDKIIALKTGLNIEDIKKLRK